MSEFMARPRVAIPDIQLPTEVYIPGEAFNVISKLKDINALITNLTTEANKIENLIRQYEGSLQAIFTKVKQAVTKVLQAKALVNQIDMTINRARNTRMTASELVNFYTSLSDMMRKTINLLQDADNLLVQAEGDLNLFEQHATEHLVLQTLVHIPDIMKSAVNYIEQWIKSYLPNAEKFVSMMSTLAEFYAIMEKLPTKPLSNDLKGVEDYLNRLADGLREGISLLENDPLLRLYANGFKSILNQVEDAIAQLTRQEKEQGLKNPIVHRYHRP